MLDSLFRCGAAMRRLRSSPFGPWLDSFTDRLASLGYTPWSCRSCVVLAADLGRWMAEHEKAASALDESEISACVKQRKTQRERRGDAALRFLEHLRAEGIAAPRPHRPDRSPIAVCCGRYEEHLRRERGACDGTVEGYAAVVRAFLRHRFNDGPIDLKRLKAGDIQKYMIDHGRSLSPRRVGFLGAALRSFSRCLFARGETPSDLSPGILVPRTTRLSGVPKYLSAVEVEKLLDACDLKTGTGRRDHAILLLLARLGLRAGEVARLELGDIRWRSGEIVVRGKGNNVDRLPLLKEVGKALALYLVKDRPKSSSRRLFFRRCAPLRPLVGREAISTVVRTTLEKAGLHPPVRGAHLLRYSLGTRMIRGGASMAEIGEVLRHHSPGTTEIYAKVDFEALRTLAQAWPRAGGAR
jgi:site-specific recombinase XerD